MSAYRTVPPPKKVSLALDAKGVRRLHDSFGGKKHREIGAFIQSRLKPTEIVDLFHLTKAALAQDAANKRLLAADNVKPDIGVGALPQNAGDVADAILRAFGPDAVRAIRDALSDAIDLPLEPSDLSDETIPAPVAPGELSSALPQQAQDAICRVGADTYGMQARQRPATRPFSSAVPEAARAAAARIARL